MKQKQTVQTKDFLIRNLPLEVHSLLEKAAKSHHRSKTQEAIVVLSSGLSQPTHQLQQPQPFNWKEKPTSEFIRKAIKEGRE
jgi:hypothetical protein